MASTRLSAASVSYTPVGRGLPSSPITIFSTVSAPPGATPVTALNQRMVMPSSSASATSKSCAGMSLRRRR
jgi:hypothetical protein